MRGDLARGRSLAQQHIAAAYGTPTHCHNPLERGVAIVRPSDAGLEVFTATSGIFAARRALAQALGRPETGIVVRMLYQGAGFGAKGGAWWPSLILAASVAVALGRPLQLELTRRDMFTVSGRRAPTRQQLSLGAADGLLTYLDHEAIQETSPTARYADPTGFATRSVYGCANVATRHRLVTTNIPQPNAMRAPGETPGSFALESAIDELAHATGRDPVDFRLANIAARDEQAGRDWSSNGLAACLRGGARAFGWHGSGTARHEGRWAIGQGVAAAYYPVHRARAEARLTRTPEGIVILSCGNQDIGNGSRTVMAEAAARILGLDAAAIEVRYGDTTLPEAPMSAGSMSTASVIPAVEAAARALQAKLSGRRDIGEITASGVSDVVDNGFSHSAFGACFVRVKIDRGLGLLRLVQVTGVYALGRVINERLTRAQLVGGIVGGIGGALMERVEEDAATGLPLNRHLSGYLVPTCADMPAIDVRLLAEPAAAGIKGAGMIGSVGIAAAIANAVFDATGRRIRNLPIGVEALLG
jgi:xanthine dehydrogenase YagR molybdenum-binding subunit